MNKIKLTLIFVLVIFVGISDVFAGSKVVCEYEIKLKMANYDGSDLKCSNTATHRVYLSYGDSGYFIQVPQSCYYGKCEACDKIFKYDLGTSKDYISMSDKVVFTNAASEKFAESKCPDSVYLDLYGMRQGDGTDVETCFGTKDECYLQNAGDKQFYKHTFTGKKSVEQSAGKLVYGIGYTHAPKAEAAASKAVKNKYKVDPNKEYDELVYCKQLSEDVDTLITNITNDYNNAFTTYLQNNVYKGVSATIQNETRKYIDAYKQGDDTLPSTIADTLRTDCAAKLEASKKTEEEKTEISTELDNGFTELIQSLSEYFVAPYSFDININPSDFAGNSGCEGFLGNPGTVGSPAYFLKLIMNIIKYLGIIMCLLFSIIDFVKAITSQDQDLLKKAIGVSVKRLVYAIIIFFLPIVINFILGLIGAYSTCL